MRATIRVLERDLLEPPWEATLPAELVNPTGSRPRATGQAPANPRDTKANAITP